MQIQASDITAPVRALITLVRCRETIWRARVRIPKQAAEVAESHGARAGAVNATKFLFPGCDAEYKAVAAAVRRATSSHRSLTAPWKNDGSGFRALANVQVFEYMKIMAGHKADIDLKRGTFKQVYATVQQAAMANLGDLANASDYVAVEEIDDKFGFEFGFEPVPDGADFNALPQGVDAALAAKLNESNNARLSGVTDHALGLLKAKVEHMRDVFVDEDNNKWRSSVIGNIDVALNLARGFNLTGSADYDSILVEAAGLVQSDMKSVKKDVELKRTLRAHADRVLVLLVGVTTVKEDTSEA